MEYLSPHIEKKASDGQTVIVIILAAIFGLWRSTFGTPGFFDHYLSGFLGLSAGGFGGYAYFFITQGIVGFVIPVFVLVVLFKRRPADIGLGLGDVKFALIALLIYIPVVTVGCWFLSKQAAFHTTYPMFKAVVGNRALFVIYELLFLIYFIGWEYLWRGFLLFGTAPTFGRYAILIQMLPFAALHATKPAPEAYLSIVGALLVGALVWRCRSFWIAVPIHAYQMLIMDVFCSLNR